MTVHRRGAKFLVSNELLEDALHIPEKHYIIGAEWSFTDGCIMLYVTGPDLPEIQEGGIVPTVRPTITRDTAPEILRITTFKWDWGV